MYSEEANQIPTTTRKGQRKPSHAVQLRKYTKMQKIYNDHTMAALRARIEAQGMLTPEEELEIEARDKAARERYAFDASTIAGQSQITQAALDQARSPELTFNNNVLTFVSPDDDIEYLLQCREVVQEKCEDSIAIMEVPSCLTGYPVQLDAFLMPIIPEAPGAGSAVEESPLIDEDMYMDEDIAPGSPEYRPTSPDYSMELPDYVGEEEDFEAECRALEAQELARPSLQKGYADVDVEHSRSTCVIAINKTIRLNITYTFLNITGQRSRVVTGCKSQPPCDAVLQSFASKIKVCKFSVGDRKDRESRVLNGFVILVPPCNVVAMRTYLRGVAVNHSMFIYGIREFVSNGRSTRVCYC